jgi:GNAT superfamily N-acetyltransferase
VTTHRPAREAGDLDRTLDLLQRIYAAAGPRVRMTPGDLEYWRFQTTDPDSAFASAELWLADGAPAGFVWPAANVLDLAVHPDHADLLPAMLDWGEAWQRERGHPAVQTPALESDAAWEELLRARGYAPTGDAMHWYRVRPLAGSADAIPAAPLPAGYALRSGADADALARLQAAARAGPPIPASSYRALPGSRFYRTDLDLVATTADGTPMAFALVWFDAANGAGLFEPVGCHPDHRRRGLATALLCEGLRRLRDLGATHALVANRVGNEAAGALYESVGFAPDGRSRTWRKPLS